MLSGAPESPTPARPASGEAMRPRHPPTPRRDAVQDSSRPSPNSRKIPMSDSPFWAGSRSAFKEQGNYHARGLSPIAPRPSAAVKLAPGPGPLAKAVPFEERAPHFTPRCTLSPQTCTGSPAPAAPAETQAQAPWAGRPSGCWSPVRTAQGFPMVSRAGPAARGAWAVPCLRSAGALLSSHL